MPRPRKGIQKVEAKCEDCGKDIWTLFPRVASFTSKTGLCSDCAFDRMKARIEADPILAAKFADAVLGRTKRTKSRD